MRVGIYTHYAHCDQAYLAIRLVDFLRSHGIEFDLYSDSKPARLKTPYDNVVKYRPRMSFTTWAKQQSCIVWTHVPKLEQLKYVNRFGLRTVIAPMWQELVSPYKKVLRKADHVVALSDECKELYTDIYKIKSAVMIPYDAGLPITKKTAKVNHKRVKIFLPWFDRNARCANSDFLAAVSSLFTQMPDAELTVAIMSSRFSPAVAKFFQGLGRKTQGRVKLIRNVQPAARAVLYADNDLTLYPAECDNFGLCGLTSINCGTPVLSFAISPQLDFVYPDANGLLVKTAADYDENGVVHAVPDYGALMEALQALIDEPRHIDNLNKRINYNLISRRKAFELGWLTVLGII